MTLSAAINSMWEKLTTNRNPLADFIKQRKPTVSPRTIYQRATPSSRDLTCLNLTTSTNTGMLAVKDEIRPSAAIRITKPDDSIHVKIPKKTHFCFASEYLADLAQAEKKIYRGSEESLPRPTGYSPRTGPDEGKKADEDKKWEMSPVKCSKSRQSASTPLLAIPEDEEKSETTEEVNGQEFSKPQSSKVTLMPAIFKEEAEPKMTGGLINTVAKPNHKFPSGWKSSPSYTREICLGDGNKMKKNIMRHPGRGKHWQPSLPTIYEAVEAM